MAHSEADDTEQKAPPKADEAVVIEAEATWPLAVGLFLLGSVVGGVTGASTAEGISTTLISSLLTFVAGSVLTFAGFRLRRRPGEQLRVSPKRVGSGLIALSLGVWLGVGVGVGAKIRWMIWREQAEAKAEKAGEEQRREDAKAIALAVLGSARPAQSTSGAPVAPAPIVIQLPCAEAAKAGAKKSSELQGPLQVDPHH